MSDRRETALMVASSAHRSVTFAILARPQDWRCPEPPCLGEHGGESDAGREVLVVDRDDVVGKATGSAASSAAPDRTTSGYVVADLAHEAGSHL
jgi:hypothetical protein